MIYVRRDQQIAYVGGALAVLVALLIVFLWPDPSPSPFKPVESYAPCTLLVAGPTPLWACSNGRAYVRQGKVYVDAGPLTPVAEVPKG